MKKSILFYVQDAYGYLVCCDADSFSLTKENWLSGDCKFTISKKETDSYISYILWRV